MSSERSLSAFDPLDEEWRYAPIESMNRDVEVWNTSECLWTMNVWGDPNMEFVTGAGRLTAAAPDMYRVLKHLRGSGGIPFSNEERDLIDVALAKARGEGYCDDCGRKLGDECCCKTEEVEFDA